MKPKLPNFVVLLILTTLTVIMWLGLSVYRSLAVKEAPVVPEEVLKPLNPVLDQTIINEIESRQVFEASENVNTEKTVDINDINVDSLNIDSLDEDLEL